MSQLCPQHGSRAPVCTALFSTSYHDETHTRYKDVSTKTCSPSADGFVLTIHLPPSAFLPPKASREVSGGSEQGGAGAGAAEKLRGSRHREVLTLPVRAMTTLHSPHA